MATTTQTQEELLRRSLRGKVSQRRASLTDVEAAFLHALLIDPPTSPDNGNVNGNVEDKNTQKEHVKQLEHVSRVLDDDMLFTVPSCLCENDSKEEKQDDIALPRKSVRSNPKKDWFLVGLWRAHEEGFTAQRLATLSPRKQNEENPLKDESETKKDIKDGTADADAEDDGDDDDDDDDDTDAESIKSDEEVRNDKSTAYDGLDDISDSSSLAEDDCGFENYDAWQVLKDEYANDFGFDFSLDSTIPDMDDSELEQRRFKILGTSADDKSAHPHVLSPPLMDALMNFIPDHLSGSNMWLKYSLVRDGSSMDTLKRYVRASNDTFLAIETTKGEVFGCYTSSAWRNNLGFYGGYPSFVWRMRHSRTSPCHSLIEQAQLESEINVYCMVGREHRVQCCHHDMIGVGEGDVHKVDEFGNIIEDPPEESDFENYGFAIALSEDLLSGTSSNCSSFKNPCLVDPSSHGEPFDVLNLEVWTFTACMSVDSAEKLEMTQFFVQESTRTWSMASKGSTSSQFSSKDFDQDQFYRRVGRDDDHENERDRWQYRSMMDGNIGTRAFGAAPRFTNAST